MTFAALRRTSSVEDFLCICSGRLILEVDQLGPVLGGSDGNRHFQHTNAMDKSGTPALTASWEFMILAPWGRGKKSQLYWSMFS